MQVFFAIKSAPIDRLFRLKMCLIFSPNLNIAPIVVIVVNVLWSCVGLCLLLNLGMASGNDRSRAYSIVVAISFPPGFTSSYWLPLWGCRKLLYFTVKVFGLTSVYNGCEESN